MPNLAARPIPTIKAVGVAKPMAQGQEITKTAIILVRAERKSSGIRKKYQVEKTIIANTTTAGTKYSEILSTRSCTGAREAWASSTI